MVLLCLLMVMQACSGECLARWEGATGFVVGLTVGLAVALLYSAGKV